MKTKELRALLNHFGEKHDDRKVIILIGQEEVEIDAIIITVGGANDRITRISVKNESLRLDLPPYPTGPLSYIERGPLHPSASPEMSHTSLPPDQMCQSDGQLALSDVRVSVATLEHLREWRRNYQGSLARGVDGSSNSSTNVKRMHHYPRGRKMHT
jgi:hypothetical protein